VDSAAIYIATVEREFALQSGLDRKLAYGFLLAQPL